MSVKLKSSRHLGGEGPAGGGAPSKTTTAATPAGRITVDKTEAKYPDKGPTGGARVMTAAQAKYFGKK